MISLKNKNIITPQNDRQITHKSTKSWKYYAVLVCVCVAMMWNVECSDVKDNPLITAVRNGEQKKVEALLKDASINVNATDQCGFTPLMWASLHGHVDIINCILDDKNRKSKVDVNIKNDHGWTALRTAYGLNRIPTFKLLALYQSATINEVHYPKEAEFINDVVTPFNLYYKSHESARKTLAGKLRVIDEYLKFRGLCDDNKLFTDDPETRLDRIHALYDKFQVLCFNEFMDCHPEIKLLQEPHFPSVIAKIIFKGNYDFYSLEPDFIDRSLSSFFTSLMATLLPCIIL